MVVNKVSRLIYQPKQLYLLDGFGALLSAFFLGVILVQFERHIGLTKETLYLLAVFPIFFLIIDYCFYLNNSLNDIIKLKIICFLNLAYCAYSFWVILNNQGTLTKLGNIYFVLEIFIILVVILLEVKAIIKLRKQKLQKAFFR